MFTVQDENGRGQIGRCTASLIAPDKVMMNAHCDMEFDPDIGYFFVNINGQTQRFTLLSRDWRTFDYSEIKAKDMGAGEDLEVWTLEHPIAGLHPRTISRLIPADMSQLLAYVINNGSNDFMDMSLDKEVCQTEANSQASHDWLHGAVPDLHVGLRLNGCAVIPGNSGSPVFLTNDTTTIQAVINAGNAKNASGFANRIQCMSGIPGLPDPNVVCQRVFPPWQHGQQLPSSVELRPTMQAM